MPLVCEPGPERGTRRLRDNDDVESLIPETPGDRQRIGIARALYRNPEILILDEATSALDNKTQAVVSESLEALSATRIVIAHRLSTIRNADRIFVLVDGRLVQAGTFDELMRDESGAFAELAKRQMA